MARRATKQFEANLGPAPKRKPKAKARTSGQVKADIVARLSDALVKAGGMVSQAQEPRDMTDAIQGLVKVSGELSKLLGLYAPKAAPVEDVDPGGKVLPMDFSLAKQTVRMPE